MSKNLHFVAVSGSLRKDSFNSAILRTALELLPENTTMEIASWNELPFYNGDFDLPISTFRPESVEKFRSRLKKADAIVIASPEYNYSIPGGLKNALDWASRGEDSPLLRKPVALMGASPGMWGSIRMQFAFHALFQAFDMKVVHKPEIMIAQVVNKFDESGKFTDQVAIGLIKKKLQALKDLTLSLLVSH
jgi:chromate reductase